MALQLMDAIPSFNLPATDGKTYSLDSFSSAKLLVVIFSCNHCPYVQAYEDRMIALQRDYGPKGVQLVAINSNETGNHPEDDFPHMVERSKAKGFNFPYLRDETQEVARAYGAERTPHIFLFEKVPGTISEGARHRLRYTGRIDDNWQNPSAVKSHDLRNALDALLAGKEPPSNTPAIGCTVKWK